MDSGKTEPAPPTTFQKYFGRSRLYEFEVILFGFALVLGNRNYAWNQAIKYGYKLIALNIFLVGSAFVCLCFCMGEMTSALPFSGGIFGFVRAASGPYYGFIVACFETLFCLSISIVGVHACVEILEATGLIDSSLNPLVICLLYGFNLFVNLIGGKPFWTFVGLAGFITFVLVMIFILGTAIDVKTSSVSYVVNCARYDQKQPTNVVLAQRWITIFQFQGLQYLPLLSEYTQDPRKSIPRAMSICSVAFVLASFLVTLAACSTYPGQPGLKDVVAPLMYGYRHMLNTTLETGIWLHFPGILAPTMTML